MGTKAVPTHRSKQEATETQVWKVKHQPHAPFHSEVWSDGISPCRWSSTDWLRCLRDIETISISHIRDRHREKWSLSAIFGIDIVKSGLFYVAVVALSLIIYLFLLVFAVRIWERFKGILRVRFPNAFKH